MKKQNLAYRLLQLVSLGLSTSFLSISLLVISMYLVCFCFYIYRGHPSLFFSEIKVHGMVWCTSFAVAAGSIINQFYDQEKDQLARPILAKIRNFIKLKYKLYLYVALVVFSLLVALFLSVQIFIFFVIYHFYIWFYSHKLSRILIINNLSFVLLLLYPFGGLLFYFKNYSHLAFDLLIFLFVYLLLTDLAKDTLSQKADHIMGYKSMATEYSGKTNGYIQGLLLLLLAVFCPYIMRHLEAFACSYWYMQFCVFLFVLLAILRLSYPSTGRYLFNILKLVLLLGVLLVYSDLLLKFV